MKDVIPEGSARLFEYHCWESHDSCDARAWYRSHTEVTVLGVTNPEFGDMNIEERADAGCSLVYRVRFQDGLEWDAFEDELLESEADYERPNPPTREHWRAEP